MLSPLCSGEPKANRAKVKEHGLTFPVVLQKQWEISLLYGMLLQSRSTLPEFPDWATANASS